MIKFIPPSYSWLRYEFDMMEKINHDVLKFYIRYVHRYSHEQLKDLYEWFYRLNNQLLDNIGLRIGVDCIVTHMMHRSTNSSMDSVIIRKLPYTGGGGQYTYHIYADCEYPDIIF